MFEGKKIFNTFLSRQSSRHKKFAFIGRVPYKVLNYDTWVQWSQSNNCPDTWKAMNQTPTFLYLVSATNATFISDRANC